MSRGEVMIKTKQENLHWLYKATQHLLSTPVCFLSQRQKLFYYVHLWKSSPQSGKATVQIPLREIMFRGVEQNSCSGSKQWEALYILKLPLVCCLSYLCFIIWAYEFSNRHFLFWAFTHSNYPHAVEKYNNFWLFQFCYGVWAITALCCCRKRFYVILS